MSMGRRLLAWSSGLLLVLSCALAAAAGEPVALQGRLQLATVPDRPLALGGQWGFAWQRFVDPAWTALPTQAFAPVPASWNELRADGKPDGEAGWGSYVLQVDCPAGQALALEAVAQRTAGRLFINGQPVAAFGEPGTAPGAGQAAVYNRVPITSEFPCPLRITLHLSNFDHRSGGFVRPMMLGRADTLEQQREWRLMQHVALLSAYVFTGLIALIFFAVRRRERIPLVFGLFCLGMAVYTDVLGERLLLRTLSSQLSWFAFMRVEYLSWIGSMALFLVTLRGLFPVEIQRRAVQAVLAVLGLAGLAVLALPPAVYSHVVLPGQSIAVVVALYLAWAMLRAQRARRADARVLLFGMLAVLATLALDLLLIDRASPDRKLSTFGFALFLLSPAVVIARRMSQALNAEQRNRTLEENARLREDVDRISRHDLKTPLNSILGVTRLLRDDDRLSTEQRELVGVLQRSALRVLEMVNLSLGLFRMETGSYDFHPQAVDLRDVVTRVLVDLHSYAEACEVLLHWHGKDQAPVYVRGEELLCYSIVANVVKNAIEAAGPGRRVSVRLDRGDPVALAVHNPGMVPPELAGRFFEKYATHGKSGGTGLGTYSARLMARVQQGELVLKTDAKQGTTLTLTLPPLQGDLPLRSPANIPELSPALWVRGMPTRDVLLADDDEYTRLVNRRFLPSPPFHVETAANGQAAMDAMERHWPHYLLLDMEMPLKNGLEVARWVRQQERAGRPRCRVVMVSGNDDAASEARALAAGADRFLVKPVSREALLASLRELEGLFPAPVPSARVPSPPLVAPAEPASAAGEEIVVVEPDWVELFPDFVRIQRDTVDAMARALQAGDREDVVFLAHRAAGGLATMGLGWAARQSRAIEREARQASVEQIQERIDGLRQHLRRVRAKAA